MSLTLTTPALLFPTISLLLLAYTNRFLALAQLVRGLRVRYREAPHPGVLAQIKNLRRRLFLIRNMQWLASSSLLLAAVCMLTLFLGRDTLSDVVFGAALALLIASLALSVFEIQISVDALALELKDVALESAK
jgi:hypothetical protein